MISEAYSQLRSISSGVPAASSALDALVLLEALLAAAHEVADRDAQPLDLGVVPHVPGRVLRRVLARLRREVAEPPVHVDAHAAQQVGVALDRLVELRVEALAAVLEAVEERLVVDAGAEVRDLLDRHAAEAGDHLHRALHGVAQPDDVLLRRPLVDELADHRHRVRVVQEPRAGADLGHVVADAEHHGRGAQRADDAADAERVADRLADAVAGRDLVVAHRRGVAADLDAVDHVVGAVERLAAVERGGDLRLRAERLGDSVREQLCGLEPLRVDVVQRDLARGELGEREDVAEQVAGELDAARADERDLGHLVPNQPGRGGRL